HRLQSANVRLAEACRWQLVRVPFCSCYNSLQISYQNVRLWPQVPIRDPQAEGEGLTTRSSPNRTTQTRNALSEIQSGEAIRHREEGDISAPLEQERTQGIPERSDHWAHRAGTFP